jgi:hypothetical protein
VTVKVDRGGTAQQEKSLRTDRNGQSFFEDPSCDHSPMESESNILHPYPDKPWELPT